MCVNKIFNPARNMIKNDKNETKIDIRCKITDNKARGKGEREEIYSASFIQLIASFVQID